MDRITKEQADEFTKELNALMDKYELCFPSATWVYAKKGAEYPRLIANTELLTKFPDRSKYNQYFTLHYEWNDKESEDIIP